MYVTKGNVCVFICLYSFHMRAFLALFVIITLRQKVTFDDLYYPGGIE